LLDPAAGRRASGLLKDFTENGRTF